MCQVYRVNIEYTSESNQDQSLRSIVQVKHQWNQERENHLFSDILLIPAVDENIKSYLLLPLGTNPKNSLEDWLMIQSMYQSWRHKTLHFQWKHVLLLPKCDIERTHHKKVQNLLSPEIRLKCWLVESWHFSYLMHHQRRFFVICIFDQYVLKVPFNMCHPLIHMHHRQ